MITEVSISNFKSIKKIDNLELKPLTIFAGVNSSGKSNIMEGISFFGQAARFAKDRNQTANVPMIFWNNDIKKYPPRRIKDFIVYKRDPRKKVTLEINLKADEYFTETIKDIFHVVGMEIETVGYSFVFRSVDSFFSQKVLINGNPIVELEAVKGTSPRMIHPKAFDRTPIRHTLSSVLVKDVFTSSKSSPGLDAFLKTARQIVDYISGHAERIYFLSGERGRIDPEVNIPRPRRRPEETTPSWIGVNGQYLMEILSGCFTRELEKSREIKEWANKFQLPDIRAGYVEERLESNFRDSILDINLNSTLAGLGSRQILSIITQIFWSNSGDVIMIEEPEISLHPENQVLLHELFSEAISQGKQIICSTHSPFFILALSKIIKKKRLTLNDIAVYEVERGKEGTLIKSLELNKHGFIVSGIPSFMKVEEDLFRDWSESLEKLSESIEEE